MKNPGRYRWPIVIRSFHNASDLQGGSITTTTPKVVETWAEVSEIDSNSSQQFGETMNSVGYELIMRWRDDLNETTGGLMTASYEIVWNGFVLNINGVRDTLKKGLWETIITASRKS